MPDSRSKRKDGRAGASSPNLPDLPRPATGIKAWRSRWKRLLIFLVAWWFLLLGVAGIILPILPGLPFLFVGLYLLSLESMWVHRKLEHVSERYPRLGKMINQARDRAARIARRLRR